MNVKGSCCHYAHSIIEAKMHAAGAEHLVWANTHTPLIPWTSRPPHTDQWRCPWKWKHKVILPPHFSASWLLCIFLSGMSVRVLVLGLLIQPCNICLPFAPSCSPQETFTSKCATLRDSALQKPQTYGWKICKIWIQRICYCSSTPGGNQAKRMKMNSNSKGCDSPGAHASL